MSEQYFATCLEILRGGGLMTISIATVCRRCGRTFSPSPEDIRRGLWRVCPPCRDGPGTAGILSHPHPDQSRTGPNNASEVSSRQKRGIDHGHHR